VALPAEKKGEKGDGSILEGGGPGATAITLLLDFYGGGEEGKSFSIKRKGKFHVVTGRKKRTLLREVGKEKRTHRKLLWTSGRVYGREGWPRGESL